MDFCRDHGIQVEATLNLRTKKAIFLPCKVVKAGEKSVTVTYCAGMKKDRQTGEWFENHPVETIPAKDIVSVSLLN